MNEDVEICIVGKRCVYINDHRVAGNKPYVSENLPQHSFNITTEKVFAAFSTAQMEAELKRRKALIPAEPVTDRMSHWTMRAALNSVRALMRAGDALSFAAQTTGGTAGSDTHLMVAIDHWSAERDKQMQALRIIELEHDDPEFGAGALAPPAIEAGEHKP